MKRGMTLIELLVGVAVLVILVLIALSAFPYLQKELDLNNSTREIINNLRLAQNKTLASEGASQYGIYFNTSTTPHGYTLFKGSNYAARDVSFDKVYKLPETLEIYLINIQGGSQEVVFERLTGTTGKYGNVSMWLKDDHSRAKTIYIEGSGQISLDAVFLPSDDDRVKDSRHTHFDYSRSIDTATEKITLTFEGPVTKEIIIVDNIQDGQIYWEGEVDVTGEVQKVKIHTHRLNNPDAQFCIHRDRRYNNKALSITISGDGTGNLIEYSADGLTVTSVSLFVSNLLFQ